MSKVNPTLKQPTSVLTRLAGGGGARAAKQSNEDLLRRLVLANLLWEDMAYVDGISAAEQIKELIPKCNPHDVANLAIEARVLQKLRHIPLFITVEMCKYPEHKKYVEEVLLRIMTRPDMVTDFLALYQKENGLSKLKKLPHAVMRAIGECFNNFTEYQLAKYDRNGAIKLRDALFLSHARPDSPYREDLFRRIAERKLTVPDTWEVALSSGADKNQTWTRLIDEGKLGALAFLRNLRNMKEANVEARLIRRGLQSLNSGMLLPLNFLAAAKNAPEFKNDIQDLMLRNYQGIPKLPGYSVFVVDVSGSMQAPISGKSTFNRIDVAAAMAMFAALTCESVDIYCTAGSDSRGVHSTKKIEYPELGFGLFNQVSQLQSVLGGGGIFTRQCLEYIRKDVKEQPDRIMIFSDSQDCDRYGAKPQPFGVNNYIVDVSAHKNGVNYKGLFTAEISGWSEHFLTYIAAYEGQNNQFEEVE